jgi:glycosyltransferase involved in cell wall biosynthesis
MAQDSHEVVRNLGEPVTQVHTFPLDSAQIQGGIETWIADYLYFANEEYVLLGQGRNRQKGEQHRFASGSSRVITQGSQHRMIPDAWALLVGIVRNRRHFTERIFLHRIELMVVLRALFPRAQIVLFIHTNLKAQSAFDSGKMWQLRGPGYRLYERLAIAMADLAVVHSARDFARVSRFSRQAILGKAWFNDRVFSGAKEPVTRRGILWVGRLEKVKDPLLAVKAFAVTADRHSEDLTIIGNGSLLEAVQREISDPKLQSRIRIAPIQGQEELASTLSHARVLLHTSFFEGAPRILVEAAAQGLPLVTCEESDPEELSKDGALGVMAKTRSPEGFAQAILDALDLFDGSSQHDKVADRRGSRHVPELEAQILDELLRTK